MVFAPIFQPGSLPGEYASSVLTCTEHTPHSGDPHSCQGQHREIRDKERRKMRKGTGEPELSEESRWARI